MKILVTIPHYYKYSADSKYGSSVSRDPSPRLEALEKCILSLHQNLGHRQYCIKYNNTAYQANQSISLSLDVIVCTQGNNHVIDELSINKYYYCHEQLDIDPLFLGFGCRNVLKDCLGMYDYYCYLEDDLVLHDPFYINKIAWFTNSVNSLAVLQPNRFERSYNKSADKCYIDAQRIKAGGEVTTVNCNYWGVDISFNSPPLTPHSGCYFLNNEQMDYWVSRPYFHEFDTSYVGPLESAATLGILRTFQLFKPSMNNACFLEIEHYGDAYLCPLGNEIQIME